VSSTSALLLFFPGVVLLAFLFAWPLRRLVPRREFVGATVAVMAAVIYLYFSGSLPAVSLLGFVIGTIGLALSMGTRDQKTNVPTT
jgi:hypothetical protein